MQTDRPTDGARPLDGNQKKEEERRGRRMDGLASGTEGEGRRRRASMDIARVGRGREGAEWESARECQSGWGRRTGKLRAACGGGGGGTNA